MPPAPAAAPHLSLVPNPHDAYAIPARMVHELALGTERPHVIAARYGYDDLAYFNLLQQPMFQRLVDAKRAELAQDGSFFRYKSALLAEANLDFFGRMVHNADLPPNIRIELHKILMRGAKLDSLDERLTVSAGSGATINIIHPGAVPPPPRSRVPEQVVAVTLDPAVVAFNRDLDMPDEASHGPAQPATAATAQAKPAAQAHTPAEAAAASAEHTKVRAVQPKPPSI